MRNLYISSAQRWELALETASDQPIRPTPTSITLDVDEQAVYCALESQAQMAEGSSKWTPEITLVRILDGKATPLESYLPLEAFPDGYPQEAPLVLSFQFLPETRNLVLALANGEIAQYAVDDPNAMWDVVGAFEGGLQAAEWSPDGSLLMLATGDGKLVQMTTDFEALYEKTLRPLEFGEDAQVNVNWGSKATQFHGSLGKAAAASANQPQAPVGSSPDDDRRVRISWRGDAAFFVVSTLDAYDAAEGAVSPEARRVVRVYDRDTTLRATLEPTAGLEHVLSWRPSGNFIATSQRFFGQESGFSGGGIGRPGRHDVVFFERNGLRRLEYEGKWSTLSTAPISPADWDYKIREMTWSCDSNILGIWISRKGFDVFQLWTTGNWHWYLKLEIRPVGATRFSNVSWHPERPRVLFLSSESGLFQYEFEYETCTSHAPDGLGMVAVIDRGNALLTPFRLQNVPPPAASYTLGLHESKFPPVCLSLSSSGEMLASLAYTAQETVEARLWNLNPRKISGRGRIMSPQCLATREINIPIPLQIVLDDSSPNRQTLLVLSQDLDGSGKISSYGVESGELQELVTVTCQPNGRLVSPSGSEAVLWQSREGVLYHASTMNLLARFPVFCCDVQSFVVNHTQHAAGLASGKLYIASTEHSEAALLGSNVASLTVSGSFLIYITTAHESVYAPLADLHALFKSDEQGEAIDATKVTTISSKWEKRRVERGSRIVTTVPNAMSVVLQMPRGNLETISPRPLALEVIRSDIQRCEYGKAFAACRKHRIDLGILVEQDSERFIKDIPLFVEQVPEIDDLNLFLSTFGRGKPPELVSSICDQIRQKLQQIDTVKYIQCILTSYVVEAPPRYEDALAHLHQLREEHSQIVEDAVRYIIFLVDADKLFDIALGMYDFALVLLIAQHSQRDPREYLPFLRELKSLDKPLQRFRIDDHLRRYAKALRSLSEGGLRYFEQSTNYMEKHQLYAEGLEIWQRHPEEYQVVMALYGDWLFDRREFENAALAFEIAKKPSKAMLAYEKAHDWRRLFNLALQHHKDASKLQEIAYRVAEDLCSRKRWADAAIVYAEYAEDVEEAVRAYTYGNELGDALRLVAKSSKPELDVNIVHPGALDLCSQFSDELEEMDAQLQKQYNRIKELREAKQQNPDTFFGVEDTTLHNVDVTTDVSTPFTTFTRYTVAQTNTSRATKRTSRSKRKLDMKNAAGRRGTVEEESYILTSWGKLSTRLTNLQTEAGKLLPHLRLFSTEHSEEGKRLQDAILEFETRFTSIVEEIWAQETPTAEDAPLPTSNTNKPPKPVFGSRAWVIPKAFWL